MFPRSLPSLPVYKLLRLREKKKRERRFSCTSAPTLHLRLHLRVRVHYTVSRISFFPLLLTLSLGFPRFRSFPFPGFFRCSSADGDFFFPRNCSDSCIVSMVTVNSRGLVEVALFSVSRCLGSVNERSLHLQREKM